MKSVKTMIFAVLAVFASQSIWAQNHDSFSTGPVDPIKTVKLYPNPATDYLSVKFEVPLAKEVKITLHSIIGNTMEVESEVVDEYEIRLKVKDLPAGYYLLALKDDNNQRSSVKFLKR